MARAMNSMSSFMGYSVAGFSSVGSVSPAGSSSAAASASGPLRGTSGPRRLGGGFGLRRLRRGFGLRRLRRGRGGSSRGRLLDGLLGLHRIRPVPDDGGAAGALHDADPREQLGGRLGRLGAAAAPPYRLVLLHH